MSTSPRQSHTQARANCDRFVKLFEGTFVAWTVAGSVRRCRPTVGDIEHVIIPELTTTGLFGQSSANMVWRRLEDMVIANEVAATPEECKRRATLKMLLRERVITKASYSDGKHRWGEKYRGVMFEGVRHELFMADRENWGAILAIRTGPAEFSERLVTILKQGGKYRQAEGYVRRVIDGGAVDFSRDGVVPVPDEATFFRLCGMPLIDPTLRDGYVDNLQGARR